MVLSFGIGVGRLSLTLARQQLGFESPDFIRMAPTPNPGLTWILYPTKASGLSRQMKVFTPNAAVRLTIGLCFMVAVCAGLPLILSPGRSVKKGISAPQFVLAASGISVTDGWIEVESGDEHGGFVGDGETFAIFQLTQAAIDGLVDSAPPWSAKWQEGPVPGEIGFHCKFGTDGVGFGGPSGEGGSYFGNESLVRLLGSQDVLFDAKERCCDSIPWHNGHLIVIDLKSKKVWLSVWDF